MSTTPIVGMAAGAVLILTAVAVFWKKQEFPAGGVAVSVIGLVLIGMSQWNNFTLKAGGVSLEAFGRLQEQVQQTAAAAGEVAAQAEQASAAVEETSRQLVRLTETLELRQALSAEEVRPMREMLSALPRADREKLARARAALSRPVQ